MKAPFWYRYYLEFAIDHPHGLRLRSVEQARLAGDAGE